MNLVAFFALALFTLGGAPDVDSIRDADEGRDYDGLDTVEPYDKYFFNSTCRLGVSKEVPFPEGRFEIFRDSDGHLSRGGNMVQTGYAYLRPRHIVPSEYPLGIAIAEIRKDSSPLEHLTSFLKKDGGWTRLSLTEAKRLWGEPRRSSNYYTFDAKNFHHGEENIFHLDLYFGDEGFVEAFRIRGIEIPNPLWVRQHKEIMRGYIFDYMTDSPVGTPMSPPNFKARRGQTRAAIKCGDNKTVLDLCIRNAKGWIEVDPDTYASSDRVHPNWFETECVFVGKYPNDYCQYDRPTLRALSDWWGTPRHSSESFYTFDISCQQNAEPDIFHVDVVCDKDFHITDSRLRGPSIADAQWQVKAPPKIYRYSYR